MSKFLLLTAVFAIAAGDQLEWRWSKEKASLDYSIKQYLPDYEVEYVSPDEFYTPINLRTKDNREIIYSFGMGDRLGSHRHLLFTRAKDTIYVAEYCAIASGCTVVAFDLKAGRELWKTRLRGIGPTMHSKYSNLVNIETDGNRIVIYGNEAHGRYVEHLDKNTGKFIANKTFKYESQTR